MGAKLILVPATHTDGADEIAVHDDRQTTSDEVIRQASGLTEVQPDHTALNVRKPLRHCTGRRAGVQSGLGLQLRSLDTDRQLPIHGVRFHNVPIGRQDKNGI
jgi:hypothetical protein